MNHVRLIVEDTLVPHPAFKRGAKRLRQCLAHAANAAEPDGIPLIGESRTGKTRLIEELVLDYPKARTPEGLLIPVLCVKTPSKPTVKGLVETLLQAIGDPRYSTGTEIAKTNRLKELMRACETRMVVIDEFQHFHDKASDRVIHQVADWLKILADDTRVALVVAGLETCMAVLEQNEQLQGRFQAPIRMPRFDWANSQQRAQFRGILQAFHESIGQHFDLPVLHEEAIAFRCYCATGGLMGYLTRFLRQAVRDAVDSETTVITFEALQVAHATAVWSKEHVDGVPSPFDRGFDPTPNEALLAEVARLGVAVEPPRERQVSRASRVRRAASEVLTR